MSPGTPGQSCGSSNTGATSARPTFATGCRSRPGPDRSASSDSAHPAEWDRPPGLSTFPLAWPQYGFTLAVASGRFPQRRSGGPRRIAGRAVLEVIRHFVPMEGPMTRLGYYWAASRKNHGLRELKSEIVLDGYLFRCGLEYAALPVLDIRMSGLHQLELPPGGVQRLQ